VDASGGGAETPLLNLGCQMVDGRKHSPLATDAEWDLATMVAAGD
jgi:hypothetical protein